MVSDPDVAYIVKVEEVSVIDEVKKKLENDIVSWRELVEMCNRLGVSANRLRKILLELLASGEVVELKCRLFTSRRFVERAPRRELVDKIRGAVSRGKLRKCGKPLGNPMKTVSVIISRSGNVAVIDGRS